MYKLLIVDDNLIQIQSVIEFIDWEKLGIFEIHTATNGQEGLDTFLQFQPDIVITDVVMPIMNGIEFTTEAKKINPDSKFIFISCYEDVEYLKSAIISDVKSYILKPINPSELEKAVKKIITEIENESQLHSMSSLLNESLDVFRENFLYRFLYSRYIDENYLKSTLHNLGFDVYNLFAVAKTDFCGNGGLDSYSQISKANQILFSQLEGYAIIENEQKCVFVFMSQAYDNTKFLKDVELSLSKYADEINQLSPVLLAIGLSHAKSSLYDIPTLSNQAERALEYCLTSAGESICLFEERSDLMISYEISDIRDSLIMLLKSADTDDIKTFLDAYYPSEINRNQAKTLCISVITTLQLLLVERNLNFNDMLGNSFVVWDKLDKFDTISNTRQWLYNILDKTLEFIRNTENKNYNKIISEIKKLIDENYSKISNVEQISDEIHISASYAKSLFRKHTGMTIYDYLLKCRMEEAMKLLTDPGRKVYEVAEIVGYKSKPYFSEAFKKYFGKTPKEFQQSL